LEEKNLGAQGETQENGFFACCEQRAAEKEDRKERIERLASGDGDMYICTI
jgi:hypothetical protein